MLIPGMLGVYALAFIAGGIYYLEQRVARIRDQFPKHGPLALLVGCASLGIGLLAAISIGGYFAGQGSDFRVGALVATVAGIAFWIARIHIDLIPIDRIRNGVLAFVCALLSLMAGWWLTTI
jgi:hypothetical protein